MSGHHHKHGHNHGNHHPDAFMIEMMKKYEPLIIETINEVVKRKDLLPVKWNDPNETQNTIRVLDYACGNGLVSLGFAPYVTSILGLDSSQVMLNEYNKTVSNPKLSAQLGDLLNPSDPSPQSFSSPEFYNFNLVTCGHAFHHFPDPALAAKRLSERLAPGGVLLIIDFLPHESFQGHPVAGLETMKDVVMHNGFSEEDVRRVFEGAGLGTEFGFVIVRETVVFEGAGQELKRDVFMAWGMKG